MKPHQLLGFRTKKQATAAFSDILSTARLNEPLSDPVLAQLILMHPRAADKVGCGVSYLYVGKAAYGSRCFHVMRTDGTAENFSYRKCLDNHPR